MTDGPQQRFRGLIHLPPLTEGGSPRMAIERSELPDTSHTVGWESERARPERGKPRVVGAKETLKTTPLGHFYTKLLDSPIDVHPGDSSGKTLAFHVDEFTKHFGSHPEAHFKRMAANKRAYRETTDDPTDTTVSTPTPAAEAPQAPSSTPRPPKSKPASVDTPAPVPAAKAFTCSHCKAVSPGPVESHVGLTFLVKHQNRQCYD